MKQRTSDIPPNVIEVEIRAYREEGSLLYFRVTECVLEDRVVGQRAYDSDGNLRMETPLKDGRKHGGEYIWSENGALESVEPYVEGKLHGVAKQYGQKGNVIGTYRLVHGTGYDIWRYERGDGFVGISEIHSLQDNLPHGFEWWLKADQHSLWHERHWQQGKLHGIERMWNEMGRLKRGYPKYWIENEAVRKHVYLKAAEQDKALPKYREKDDLPQREFPDEIESRLPK